MTYVKYNDKWYKVSSDQDLAKLLQKEIHDLENLKKVLVEVEFCLDRKKVLALKECVDGKLIMVSSAFAKLVANSFLNLKKKVYFVLDARIPAIGYIEDGEFFDLSGNKVKILDLL